MKLFRSTKQLIDKTKNGEYVSSLGLVKVALFQFNLVDNQYQRKFEVFCTFMSNKSYAFLLTVDQFRVFENL